MVRMTFTDPGTTRGHQGREGRTDALAHGLFEHRVQLLLIRL